MFLLLAGCTFNEPGLPVSQKIITVNDDIGRSVALPKSPNRVISFAPNITEMIYALGAADKLVGVTAWCNYPPQVKEKPIVGDASSANLERILLLKPDLAIIVGTMNTPILSKLEGLKIPVLVLNPSNLEGIIRDITLLSHVLDKKSSGDSLTAGIRSAVEEINLSLAGVPYNKRPAVFAEISSQPLMSAGNSSLIEQLIEQAGGRNIFSDITQDYFVVNPEVVMQRNPDIILIMHPQTSKEQLSARMGWSGIPAIKTGKVYDGISLDIMLRAGPRFVLGIKELNRIFYEK